MPDIPAAPIAAPPPPAAATPWKLAVVGAGPAGLALALQAARKLPQAQVTLFDARPLDHEVSADPRTLALALGSVQLLEQLGAWPGERAQAILQVHVSQAPPTLAGRVPAEVTMRAADQGVPMLGAVLAYGHLVAAMQHRWLACTAAEPRRLFSRFGHPVVQVRNLDAARGGGVEVDAGIAEVFDLAIVAEGGVFADQARKAIRHDYQQAAWVGTVALQGAAEGLAVERFTRDGPLALLPLPPGTGPHSAAGAGAAPPSSPPSSPGMAMPTARAAMVWCVREGDDPVATLSDAQRVCVLNTLLPPVAGRVVAMGPLKRFALGLNAERSLVDGRTVRIGNAAQTLHPVAGQGLNLGLRDAVALVQGLRDARPGQLDQALRGLEWRRGPDRWAMIASTDFLARSFTWGWPGLPALRGLGLAALDQLAPVKRLLARQMMFGRR